MRTRNSRSIFFMHGRERRNGFSLTELLVVIGIIVLALGLAVPALNLIQGTKSVEQAQNLAGVMLAQVRNDAIGRQKYRGVFFYRDPVANRVRMMMVQEVDADNQVANVDVYLDLVDGADSLTLPAGVDLQTVDDAGGPTNALKNDRYLGFNNIAYQIPAPSADGTAGIQIQYGGVILFDSHGQLANRAYAFKAWQPDPVSGPVYTAMGALMYAAESDAHLVRIGAPVLNGKDKDVIPVDPTSAKIVKSQVGFVLFDEEAFKNNGGKEDDLQIASPIAPYGDPEATEEQWLDDNSMPILVNRYNGSLVKGE